MYIFWSRSTLMYINLTLTRHHSDGAPLKRGHLYNEKHLIKVALTSISKKFSSRSCTFFMYECSIKQI